jgi:archaellum biogenesis protein FlaJ (TadC family)
MRSHEEMLKVFEMRSLWSSTTILSGTLLFAIVIMFPIIGPGDSKLLLTLIVIGLSACALLLVLSLFRWRYWNNLVKTQIGTRDWMR